MSDNLNYEDKLGEDDDFYDDDLDQKGYDEPIEDIDEPAYDEDSDTLYGEETSSSYTSTVKQKLVEYQNSIGFTAGGAAGGALMFGSPEAALVFGGLAGATYLGGKATAKGFDGVRNYLSGDDSEE